MRATGWIVGRLGRGAGLLALLLLAGCGKAPKGQVLALVNDREVTVQDLTAELVDIPVPDSIDRKQLSKVVLEGVIDRQLDVEEAQRQGLDKTPQYLALKKRNDEELLGRMLGDKIAKMVPLPVESEIRAYIDSHPLQFARRQRLIFDQLSFTPPRDQRRLARLADAHSMETAAAILKSLGIATEPGQSAIDTGKTDPAIAQAIMNAPAGEPILLPQGDRLVVGVVTARAPIILADNRAYLAAAIAIRNATLLRESEAQVAAARSIAKISYEPGFEPDTPAASPP